MNFAKWGKRVNKKYRLIISVVLLIGLIVISGVFFATADIDVLQPQGTIANQQRDLLVIATLLMLIVVIPVYILTFAIAWKYRASNTKAKYSPNLTGNRKAEAIWWGIPMAIIAILAVITWQTSHSLDPFKSLPSEKQPINIQVVALQWKWLFIYPEHDIATVNHVEFPEKTPINFVITSDAPMNSFWIPSLGGQIYAMAGMSTKLHLMADTVGTYKGSSANISGEGFSDMRFVARSSTSEGFENWVQKTKQSSDKLSVDEYEKLSQKSRNNKTKHYSSVDNDLYDTIIMKYMVPAKTDQKAKVQDQNHTEGMSH